MRQPTLVRSLRHAVDGIVHTIRTQRNARIHVAVSVVVIALGLFLGLDRVPWCMLALAIGAVLAGEAINTTVEALVDLLEPEFHERAKIAKDVAAGAVLLLAATAVVVGLLVLGPPLWQLVATSGQPKIP